MRISAAVVREPEGPFVIEEVDLDDPGAGEILVKIHSVGVCHTDIGVRNQWLPVPLPAVLGHEGAGIVESVGAGVTKVVPGDQVVLTFSSCGACPWCEAGEPAYCANFLAYNVAGSRLDGTNALHGSGDMHGFFFGQSSFASHAISTERNTVKLPAGTDLSIVGPLGCGILTGAGAVLNSLAPPAGASVAVFGSGAVGLSAVMAAKVAGCTAIAIDRVSHRLDLATELGADHVIDTNTVDDVPARVRELTGAGADFSLDTTAVPAVIQAAVGALAPRGTCALLGLGPAGTKLELDMLEVLIPGRKIVGVIEGDAVPDTFIPHLVDLHAQGRFPYDRLITTYKSDEINKAVEDSEAGHTLKPVLTFD